VPQNGTGTRKSQPAEDFLWGVRYGLNRRRRLFPGPERRERENRKGRVGIPPRRRSSYGARRGHGKGQPRAVRGLWKEKGEHSIAGKERRTRPDVHMRSGRQTSKLGAHPFVKRVEWGEVRLGPAALEGRLGRGISLGETGEISRAVGSIDRGGLFWPRKSGGKKKLVLARERRLRSGELPTQPSPARLRKARECRRRTRLNWGGKFNLGCKSGHLNPATNQKEAFSSTGGKNRKKFAPKGSERGGEGGGTGGG